MGGFTWCLKFLVLNYNHFQFQVLYFCHFKYLCLSLLSQHFLPITLFSIIVQFSFPCSNLNKFNKLFQLNSLVLLRSKRSKVVVAIMFSYTYTYPTVFWIPDNASSIWWFLYNQAEFDIWKRYPIIFFMIWTIIIFCLLKSLIWPILYW